MSAGLEYLDGMNANIETGMWLHQYVFLDLYRAKHPTNSFSLVLFNVGPGREDITCSHHNISVPHISVNATSRGSERFFGVGNERTDLIFPDWGARDIGYKIKPTDRFASLVELMNETMDDRTVWLTVIYDILDGHPYKDDIRPIWMDVRQCGTSLVNPPKSRPISR